MKAVMGVSLVFLMLQLACSVRKIQRSRKKGCETFIILGDFGKMGKNQDAVKNGMAKVAASIDPHAILALGDNIYENGASSEGQMVKEWRDIWLSKPSLKRKWYAVLGNHDWISDGNVQRKFATSSRNTNQYWTMPGFWHKKRWGDVEIFFVDTHIWNGRVKSMRDQIPVQRNWLENGLKSSNAAWKIVVGHYPTWSDGTHGGTTIMKTELDPMMRKYNATIYFAGHDHTMQHIQHRNVNYVLSGAGSKNSRDSSGDYPRGSLKHKAQEYGFFTLEICNKDTATLKRYNSSGSAKYTTTLQNLQPGDGGTPPVPPRRRSSDPRRRSSDPRRRERRRSSRRRSRRSMLDDDEVTTAITCDGVSLSQVDTLCDGCTVIADVDISKTTCHQYCSDQGLSCSGAWLNAFEDCGKDEVSSCDALVANTSAWDSRLCRCAR